MKRMRALSAKAHNPPPFVVLLLGLLFIISSCCAANNGGLNTNNNNKNHHHANNDDNTSHNDINDAMEATAVTRRPGSRTKHRTVKLHFAPLSTPPPQGRLQNVSIVTTQTEVLIGIHVGGRPFSVIFDTGSSALVLVNKDAPMKGSECNLYDPAPGSASFMACESRCDCNKTASACQAEVAYADGSGGKGLMMVDSFGLDADEAVNIAQAPLVSLFEQYNDFARCDGSGLHGLWGVALRPLNCFPGGSGYCPLTIMDKLLNQKGMRNAFSMWVGNRTGNAGGVLTLGGWDTTKFVGDITWTPMKRGRYYMVGLSSLAVGENFVIENNAAVFGTGGIVDSGSTLLLFPPIVLAQLRNYMMSNFQHCANLTDVWGENARSIYYLTIEQVMCYPPLHIYTTSNVPITVPPTAYWRFMGNEGMEDGLSAYYWGIGETHADTDFTILGDIAMRPYYVTFDREAARIGFARYIEVDPLPEAPPVTPLPPVEENKKTPVWLLTGFAVGLVVVILMGVVVLLGVRRKYLIFYRALNLTPPVIKRPIPPPGAAVVVMQPPGGGPPQVVQHQVGGGSRPVTPITHMPATPHSPFMPQVVIGQPHQQVIIKQQHLDAKPQYAAVPFLTVTNQDPVPGTPMEYSGQFPSFASIAPVHSWSEAGPSRAGLGGTGERGEPNTASSQKASPPRNMSGFFSKSFCKIAPMVEEDEEEFNEHDHWRAEPTGKAFPNSAFPNQVKIESSPLVPKSSAFKNHLTETQERSDRMERTSSVRATFSNLLMRTASTIRDRGQERLNVMMDNGNSNDASPPRLTRTGNESFLSRTFSGLRGHRVAPSDADGGAYGLLARTPSQFNSAYKV